MFDICNFFLNLLDEKFSLLHMDLFDLTSSPCWGNQIQINSFSLFIFMTEIVFPIISNFKSDKILYNFTELQE